MKIIKIILANVIGLMLVSANLSADTTSPKLVEKSDPVYSEYAISHSLKGTVVVEAIVNENGKVTGTDVVESVHSELDKAAIAAVAKWKFQPATKDGVAIKQVVRIQIRFDLTSPDINLDPEDTSTIAKK